MQRETAVDRKVCFYLFINKTHATVTFVTYWCLMLIGRLDGDFGKAHLGERIVEFAAEKQNFVVAHRVVRRRIIAL